MLDLYEELGRLRQWRETIWARRKRAAVLKSIELEKDRKGRRRERRS